MLKIDELKQILKGQKPMPRVFVLWGEEAHLKAHYKKELIALSSPDMMEDMNVFMFEGKNYSLSAVDEAIEALPLMADRKLLVFTDSLIFKPDARTGAKAEYREYWEKRLEDIPEYVTIIFDEPDVHKGSKVLKLADKFGGCVEFNYVSEEEMVRWTVRLFAHFEKEISPADARYLNEITAAGMMAVRREVEKITAYVGERRQVTRADIDLLVTPPMEDKVFDMVAAMLNHKTDEALKLLSDLQALKVEVHQIMGAIIYNVDKLMQTKALVEGGADKSQIMSKLKTSPFMASKFMRDCAKYSAESLGKLVKRLAEADGHIKGYSMDNGNVMALLVAEIASAGKR